MKSKICVRHHHVPIAARAYRYLEAISNAIVQKDFKERHAPRMSKNVIPCPASMVELAETHLDLISK